MAALTLTLTPARLAKFAGDPDLAALDRAIAAAKGAPGRNIGLSLSGDALTVLDNAGVDPSSAEVNAAIDAWTPAPAATPYDTAKAAFAGDRNALVAAYTTPGGSGVVQVNNQIQALSALTLASTLTVLKGLSAAHQNFDEKLLAVLADIRDHLAVLVARG